MSVRWPTDAAELTAVQKELARSEPPPWRAAGRFTVGGSYCCAQRHTSPADRPAVEKGWAGAAARTPGGESCVVVATGALPGDYVPSLLALREGPLREAAVRRLGELPDVLIVDAAGWDHPRRAGLALHLGAVLGIATVGATDRPLAASGSEPANVRGAVSPLRLSGRIVGYWVRILPDVRPLAVHAGWRTNPEVAVDVVLAEARNHRTPQVLRLARQAARNARAAAPDRT